MSLSETLRIPTALRHFASLLPGGEKALHKLDAAIANEHFAPRRAKIEAIGKAKAEIARVAPGHNTAVEAADEQIKAKKAELDRVKREFDLARTRRLTEIGMFEHIIARNRGE